MIKLQTWAPSFDSEIKRDQSMCVSQYSYGLTAPASETTFNLFTLTTASELTSTIFTVF